MTDDRQQEKAALQVARARLWAQWQRDRYNPRAHLESVAGEGDASVFIDMLRREQAGAANRRIACRCAADDMYDQLRALRR